MMPAILTPTGKITLRPSDLDVDVFTIARCVRVCEENNALDVLEALGLA